MNTTILLFHPHLKTSRVNKTLAEAAIKAGFNVRALYDIYPDEQIDVKKEQALLESSDRIVLQFPLYWYSSPSLLKNGKISYWNTVGHTVRLAINYVAKNCYSLYLLVHQ